MRRVATGLRPVGVDAPAAAARPGVRVVHLERDAGRRSTLGCRAAGPCCRRTTCRTGCTRRAPPGAAARHDAAAAGSAPRRRRPAAHPPTCASRAGAVRADPCGAVTSCASRFSVSRAASVWPCRRSSSACASPGQRVPGIVRRRERLQPGRERAPGRRCRSGAAPIAGWPASRSSGSAERSPATWSHSAAAPAASPVSAFSAAARSRARVR